jgi:Bacteriocin-protection, YdeI or OmpD-Associated
VVEPADFARALDADPVARTVYDRRSYSRKREHVLAIGQGAMRPAPGLEAITPDIFEMIMPAKAGYELSACIRQP